MSADSLQRADWVDPDLFPFESRWMWVRGHQVHYVDEGPRNAPVILFLHDGVGWSFTYRYHIEQLRTDFRCVALDFPGWGLSLAVEGYRFTLREQCGVLEEFVEALDLRNIIIWANDGGGPTGVIALARHQERVLGLVIGGTFGWPLRDYPTVSRILRLVSGLAIRFINRYTNLLPKITASRGFGTRSLSDKERRHYIRPYKNRETRNRTLKLFRSFLDPATQEELRASLPPFHDKAALIQFGKRDPMTGQRWPERWGTEIPDSRVIILPGVRHFTFDDAPETTVQNFRAWWAEMKWSQASVGAVRDFENEVTSKAA